MTDSLFSVSFVLADDGSVLGLEVEDPVKPETYYITNDPGWRGFRVGRFPCRSDGGAFERVQVYPKAEGAE